MILFDLDGTLIDSNGIWFEVDNEFLARRGRAVTQEYSDYVAHSIFPLAAQFTKEYYDLAESPEDIMAEWLELARDAYRYQAPLKPGVLAYLERCKEAGETMVLFTASVPELVQLVVERYDLYRYLSGIVYAQDIGLEKSNPGAFLIAVDQMGGEPDFCTVFDDSPRNCAAAMTAGFTVVGVYDDYSADVQDELMANSSFYVRSFEELL